MPYVLVLLAMLGAFVWATPAHTAIAQYAQRISLQAQIDKATTAIRTKSMELLREQLHGIVNEMVR
jgi:hypothetical protein